MERRRLGRSEVEVTALCLGTMMYGDQIDARDAFAQMDVSFERGVDFFDTAELYTIPPKPETQGESERIVGAWMKDRGRRANIFLASKVTGRSTLSYLRDEDEEVRLTPKQIRFAVERSLVNLQTDYIDLYQTHWPDRPLQLFGSDLRGFRAQQDDSVAIEETMSALTDLQKEGKIRHFGLSNETPWGVMRHLAAARNEERLARPQSIQNAYNLLNRNFEQGLAEIAMREDIGLLAYSPIGQGVLSGKYLGGASPEGSRGQLFGRLGRYQTPGAEKAISAYVALAQERGVNPAALAMQFVTTRPFVTSNIFGVRTLEQLDVVFQSLEIEMDDALQNAIDDIHAEAPNPCP